MATYDRSGQNQNNSLLNFSTVDNTGYYNRILRGLSKFGMDFNDLRIKNSYSIGTHEDTNSATYEPGTNMYNLFTKKIISRVLDQKSIAYLDRAYLDKRKILRQYSIKDEIREVMKRIAGEVIIYDEDNEFCKVKDLSLEFPEHMRQKYQENFTKIVNAFRLNDGLLAYNYLKNLLIDGYIAFEIVYDNKQKNIIDLSPIDPITLIMATDPGTNTIVWIQHPDNPQLRRVLLDAQIIYISYSNSSEFAESSYIEGLIRPYNQWKMLEQTKILYNINQASIYKKFVIPTNGLTRVQAEAQINHLMSEYHEDVQWDDTMGTVSINGSTNIPHSKDYWFPSSESGTPDISIMKPESNDLNEDVMLKWFYNNFKRATQIPMQRFDSENSGGGNLYQDVSDITRDEIVFKDFIDRLRTIYKELITKPVKIQMILDFPEIKDNETFKSSIKVEFNKNGLFEEWKQLHNLQKRAEISSTLISSLQGPDGQPYFSMSYIVRHIMKLSDEEINENNMYKQQDAKAAAGGQQPGGDGGMPDMGGGFGGGDFGGAQFGGGGAPAPGGQFGQDFGAPPQGGQGGGFAGQGIQSPGGQGGAQSPPQAPAPTQGGGQGPPQF